MVCSPDKTIQLFDAMILIAARSLGFAAARSQYAYANYQKLGYHLSYHMLYGGIWIVAFLALAVILVELRSGRPVRYLSRQPGFIACVSILVAVAFLFLSLSASILIPRSHARFDLTSVLTQVWVFMPYTAPYSVGGSWATLALSGRWRGTRSWVELLGWICGLFFLAWQVLVSLANAV